MTKLRPRCSSGLSARSGRSGEDRLSRLQTVFGQLGKTCARLLLEADMGRWRLRIGQLAVLSDNELAIFYPYGPLRGYALRNLENEPAIAKSMTRASVIVALMTLAEFAILIALGKGWMTAVILSGFVLNFACYWLLIHRLTRSLVPVPFAFGFRFYARRCDDKLLREKLIAGLILSAAMIPMLLNSVDLLKTLLALFFGFGTIEAGLLTYLRNRQPRSGTSSTTDFGGWNRREEALYFMRNRPLFLRTTGAILIRFPRTNPSSLVCANCVTGTPAIQ